jgi:hypothetical protein
LVLRLEPLESRSLLTVTAIPDVYPAVEDTAISVGSLVIVPRHSLVSGSDGWRFTDDILRSAPGYPLDAGGRFWTAADYDPDNVPSLPGGQWKSGSAPFTTRDTDGTIGITNFRPPTYTGPVTDLDMPSATKTTALFLRRFDLTGFGSPPTSGRAAAVCDDSCIGFINGQEVFRQNMPPGPADTNTFSNNGDTGSETSYTFHNTLTNFASIGWDLTNPDGNVLAIELHNNNLMSTDLGFDVEVALNVGGGGVLANDVSTTPPAMAGDPAGPIPAASYPVSLTVRDAGDPGIIAGQVQLLADGSFIFAPAANYSGVATFEYGARDGSGGISVAAVTIDVAPLDDPPTAVNDSYTVTEDTPLDVNLPASSPEILIPSGSTWDYFDDLENSDPDYPPDDPDDPDATPGESDLWFSDEYDPSSVPASAGLWKIGDGAFVERRAPGDGLTCCPLVTELFGDSASETTFLFRRTFQLSPGGLAGGPTAAAANIAQLRARYVIDDGAVVRINGVEVDRVNLPPSPNPIQHTTVADANGDEGTTGGGLPTTVLWDIPPGLLRDWPQDNLIAVELHNLADSSDAGFDLEVAIPAEVAGLISNDFDVDGDTVASAEVVPGRLPGNGNLLLNPDGTFYYLPFPDFFGADTFQYTVTAGGVQSAPATVTITVTPTPDPPIARSDHYTITNRQMLMANLADKEENLIAATAVTLLAKGSTWQFLADGSDQGTAWRDEFYPPADAWPEGVAEIGFGDGDENTLIPPAQQGQITYYFRSQFSVADVASISDLVLHVEHDDGVAVYLNGVEIYRNRLIPAAAYNQLASVVVEDPADTFHSICLSLLLLPPGTLKEGLNTLAVEVHQASLTSSDVSFDLAITLPAPPPMDQFGVLANDSNPDGPLSDLTLTLLSLPSNVEFFQFNSNGTFKLDPTDEYEGPITFSYELSSPTGDTSTTDVVVDVVPSSFCTPDADLNNDGVVDATDLAILAGNYGRDDADPEDGDLDCDGDVDLSDVGRMAGGFTAPSPPAAAAVDTPGRGLSARPVRRSAPHRSTSPVSTSVANHAQVEASQGRRLPNQQTLTARRAPIARRGLVERAVDEALARI